MFSFYETVIKRLRYCDAVNWAGFKLNVSKQKPKLTLGLYKSSFAWLLVWRCSVHPLSETSCFKALLFLFILLFLCKKSFVGNFNHFNMQLRNLMVGLMLKDNRASIMIKQESLFHLNLRIVSSSKFGNSTLCSVFPWK